MRKISIELEVNGVKESVKTIGELETAIEQLKEELKGAEIGSENFNKLTNELNKANSQLKGLEQTFEGIDPQQKTQAYLAFGESVVSGVLLAQEALRAFGVENEQVNKAVEASTQAINIALQARIVIEGVLEARVLATTIAQNALNTSIVAGNRVLKILFATMAANPIGAILAVVGLLVAAFIALSDSTEEAKTQQEEYNDIIADAQKQTAKQIAQLNFYQKVVNDTRRSEEERVIALEELEKAGIKTNDVNLDNVDSLDKLNERLALAKEAILLKAESEAVASLLAESYKEVIEAQNTELEDNLSFWEKAGFFILKYTTFLGSITSDSLKAERALQNQSETINQAQEKLNKFQQIFLDIQEKLLDNQAKIREDIGKKTINELDRFRKVLDGIDEEVNKLNRSLLELGETPTPKIIDDLEELVAQQIRLREITEESRKTLGDVFNDYTNNVVKAVNVNDEFGESYETTRKQLTDAFRTGDVETFQEAINKVYETYFDENSKFNDEQRRTISQLLSGYQVAFQQLQQFGIDSSSEFDTIVSPLLESLADKLKLEGEIRFERVSAEKDAEESAERIGIIIRDSISESTKTLSPVNVDDIDLSRVITGISIYQNKINEVIASELELEDVLKGSEEFYNLRNDLINTFTQEFLKGADLQKIAEEDRGAAQEEALKRAQQTADGIIEIITNTAIAEDAIRGVYNEVEDLQIQIQDNARNVDVFLGLIIENFDEIGKQVKLDELLDPTAALEDNFQKIVSFFESIGVESVDILFTTEEEKLAIINLFLKKREELLKENAEKEKETQEDLLETTLSNYQEIVNGLNQLTLSLGEASQLQIERIETRREESLNNIVGDTEEAEALRTEITEQANKEIVEIERRARLRELQFTKIQAIADLAQALINAQKLPPPFNAIQSGIIGTAGSIQIGIIQAQIDDLQGAQGFKTGGYVSGEGTGTSDSIPAFLSNGEFVVNAKATKQFLPLLEQINNEEQQIRKFANGGFVLDSSIIPSTNIQNIFDDSRIIEELRKTRQEPLRAYVFEKDITEAQQIEKRLQELSKL